MNSIAILAALLVGFIVGFETRRLDVASTKVRDLREDRIERVDGNEKGLAGDLIPPCQSLDSNCEDR